MSIVNLSAPWIEYYRKLEAMFEGDPNVTIIYDGVGMRYDLYVENEEIAEALTKLLKPNVEFGNVVMPVVVHFANEIEGIRRGAIIARPYTYASYNIGKPLIPDPKDDHYLAFKTNTAMDTVEYAYGPGGVVFTYVIFAPRVVQYFADDTSDYYGLKSTLYEDIAREIFIEEPGVFYCTNKVLGKGNDEEDQ